MLVGVTTDFKRVRQSANNVRDFSENGASVGCEFRASGVERHAFRFIENLNAQPLISDVDFNLVFEFRPVMLVRKRGAARIISVIELSVEADSVGISVNILVDMSGAGVLGAM